MILKFVSISFNQEKLLFLFSIFFFFFSYICSFLAHDVKFLKLNILGATDFIEATQLDTYETDGCPSLRKNTTCPLKANKIVTYGLGRSVPCLTPLGEVYVAAILKDEKENILTCFYLSAYVHMKHIFC